MSFTHLGNDAFATSSISTTVTPVDYETTYEYIWQHIVIVSSMPSSHQASLYQPGLAANIKVVVAVISNPKSQSQSNVNALKLFLETSPAQMT